MPRLVSWTVGCFAAALQMTAAGAQGNIDAGKTPAQIFGDTCSACHRSARDLRRASASFLRAHYTTGSDEAAAMASYLSGLGGGAVSEPRPAAQATPAQPKQRPATEVAKQSPVRPAIENGKSGLTPAQPKARPATTTSATAQARIIPMPEERHADLPAPVAPTPPAPVLVPFEE